ncbi:MAG TPA: hypothetical protein VKZ58_09495 [Longimicrobiales bacterium]|nr:hypothetical protein [Longimicrobiales bacterium]
MRDPMLRVPRAGDASFWYNLCLATIGLSALFYVMGRKHLGLFVGLWPPTLAALGNRAELNEELTNVIQGRPIERIGGGTVVPEAGFGGLRPGTRPAAA